MAYLYQPDVDPDCVSARKMFFYYFRTEYSTVIVNKTVTRLCSSVVCCPGFSLSNGTCESGKIPCVPYKYSGTLSFITQPSLYGVIVFFAMS